MMNLVWTPKTIQTDAGVRSLPVATVSHRGYEFEIIDVESMFPDENKNWTRPLSEVTGFAWHHDAVVFDGKDKNFNGHKTDEEFQRLRAIWNYHKQQGWNGIGYHAVGGLENRIYVPRKDVLNVHRAHVSTSASSGTRVFPAPGAPVWNRQLIGFCHMGDWTQQGIPPMVARIGADAWFKVATDALNKQMTLRPHKYYQTKECPGSWTTTESWGDLMYKPGGNTAPLPPTDKPSTHTVAPRESLSLIGLKYGISVEDLAAWNNIKNPDRIEVGQILRLTPPGDEVPDAAQAYKDGYAAASRVYAAAVSPAVQQAELVHKLVKESFDLANSRAANPPERPS